MKRVGVSVFVLWFVLIIGCTQNDLVLDEKPEGVEKLSEELHVPEGFNFETIKDYKIYFAFLDNENQPMSDVVFELFDYNPEEEEGNSNDLGKKEEHIYLGTSGKNGKTEVNLRLASTIKKIYLCPKKYGLPSVTEISLSLTSMNKKIGGKKIESLASSTSSLKSTQAEGYKYIGAYDYSGAPVGMSVDVFDDYFIPSVEATLPEQYGLHLTKPEYFKEGVKVNPSLLDDAEISATFVHEGAAYRNSIGYFYYKTGNPPRTVEEIENRYLIFPNASFYGSGGGMYTGDKVDLLYYNEETKEFQTHFPEGITLGWFLVANGYRNFDVGVNDTDRYVWYSLDYLNVEKNEDLRKHIVTLYDPERELLLVGIEDVHREIWSDQDFNDVVFYVTISPGSAVDFSGFEHPSAPIDTDKDGIIDAYDEYPKDPERAFNMYYPGKETYNTMVFEDMWPEKGDYDFNDMVIDYNLHFVLSPKEEFVNSTMTINLLATGAGNFNGLGIEFPFKAADVESVKGYKLTVPDLISMRDNGLEQGHDNAVYIIFDNSFDHLYKEGEFFINTHPEIPYVEPVQFVIETEFNPGVSRNILADKYFNPFVFQNKIREVEVHLPGYTPTKLANTELFGTKDDDTDGTTQFYVTKDNMPWALEFPENFKYPIEDGTIMDCYKHFITWSNSGGSLYPDWMEDLPGYRNNDLIYSKPE